MSKREQTRSRSTHQKDHLIFTLDITGLHYKSSRAKRAIFLIRSLYSFFHPFRRLKPRQTLMFTCQSVCLFSMMEWVDTMSKHGGTFNPMKVAERKCWNKVSVCFSEFLWFGAYSVCEREPSISRATQEHVRPRLLLGNPLDFLMTSYGLPGLFYCVDYFSNSLPYLTALCERKCFSYFS